jgi:prepilin-type N-terminal cleavage/methylation domain-containing protein
MRGARGMTLIEVLVVTSLLALVVGGLLPMLTAGQQTWEHAHRRQDMVQNARSALDHLIHTLRAAQSFVVISSTNIRFSYFFGDGAATPTIEYQLNGATNELEYRQDPDAFQPLAGPFRSMSVQCFDGSGATIACTSVTSVRSVEVSLVVMDPQGQIPDITVTSRAFRQVP